MPAGRYWTEEELEWLKNNYNLLSAEECAKKLNRTTKGVYHKLSRMHLLSNGEDRKLRIRFKEGYLYVSSYNDEIAIHRAVAEYKLGRPLLPNEVAHHIDGNKLNNSPDNIKVVTRSNHTRVEHTHDRDDKGRFIN